MLSKLQGELGIQLEWVVFEMLIGIWVYDILELGMEDDSHSNLTFISYTYDEMTSSKSEGRMNSLGNSYIHIHRQFSARSENYVR